MTEFAIEDAVSLPTEKTHLFDPPIELGRLRGAHPLCRLRYADGSLGWLVTSHALARTVLMDSRFGMDARSPVGDPHRLKDIRVSRTVNDSASLLALDPPAHTRFRRLVAANFAPRHVGELEPEIERIVNRQLDAMEQTGPEADLVSVFALPIAVMAHCSMLGVPVDHDLFAPISQPFFLTASEEDVRACFLRLEEYLFAVIERKRAEPSDDLISAIVAREDLSDDEVASLAFNFMTGGRGSTEDMLALAVLALLCHPEEMNVLVSGAVSLEAACEELLRYIANFAVAVPRRALIDIELEGTLIKAGEPITVSLAAANRDPGKFEEPDQLDLRRTATGHLAFGQGPHVCLGQHIARLELRLALTGLLSRFPALRLAVPASDVQIYGSNDGGTTFGVHELPVTW